LDVNKPKEIIPQIQAVENKNKPNDISASDSQKDMIHKDQDPSHEDSKIIIEENTEQKKGTRK